MITILKASTDMPIRSFEDDQLAAAIAFVLFECEPDAEVFQGTDSTRCNGVPAAKWANDVELPYAPHENDLAAGLANYASTAIMATLNA